MGWWSEPFTQRPARRRKKKPRQGGARCEHETQQTSGDQPDAPPCPILQGGVSQLGRGGDLFTANEIFGPKLGPNRHCGKRAGSLQIGQIVHVERQEGIRNGTDYRGLASIACSFLPKNLFLADRRCKTHLGLNDNFRNNRVQPAVCHSTHARRR